MNESIFYIDYCLDVYSKLKIWDGEIKKYNPNTGRFETIEDNKKVFKNNAIEIDLDTARKVIKDTIHSNYSYCLEDNDEKWLERYELESKKRPELLNNQKLMFNYLILKAKKAGLDENIACQLYGYYFKSKNETNIKLQTIPEIINYLDSFINKKEYWIPNIEEELNKEFSIIDDIMVKRMSTVNFDFSFFESRYLNICNQSYIKKIYLFNSEENNYVKNPKTLEDMKPFLFKFYKKKINEFMDILTEKYEYFKSNLASRTMIYKNMEEILQYSIRFW